LLTHISALRKEVNLRRQTGSSGDASSQDHGDDILVGRRWSTDHFTGTELEKLGTSTDPTKLLSRKRVQHTYSLKASKRPKVRGRPARDSTNAEDTSIRRYVMPREPNMYLATPIVRRVQGHWSSPLVPEPVVTGGDIPTKSGRCYHSHEACAKRCFFEERLATLRTSMAPSTFALYESIYRAFDALLRATSATEAQVARPKSLMAMCLRKVPDYLAELESWRLQELEESGTSSVFDDNNTSFEVYSDLENLGMGKCGWKHLAIVVQSHGIRVVKDAILERLMADDFAILLSDLCSELKAVGDRWHLLEAVVSQQHRKPCAPIDNTSVNIWSRASPALQLLLPRQKDRTGTAIFKARLTTDLLCSRLLPQEWILSNVFGNTWSIAMRYLTSRTAYHDAIPFFTASIQLYCNQIQQNGRRLLGNEASVMTAEQLLINSLATLSTLVLLGQETLATEPDSSWRDQTSTLCKRAKYILRSGLATASGWYRRPSRRCSNYVLLLAVFFTTEATADSREERLLLDFWMTVERGSKDHTYRQYYEATVALMTSIARGCTRKNSAQPAHVYLVKLCDKLDIACSEVKALRRIRVDAAFHLADLTGDLWDLNFAEQLAATTRADQATTRQTPSKNSAVFSGFRWDEGISEWITVTPEIARRKQPVHDRVTRARRRVSPGVQTVTQEAESQPESSPLRALDRVVRTDVEEISNHAGDSEPCRRGTSSEPGTSCHAKRPSKQRQAHPTYDKPGSQTSKPGGRARVSPESTDFVSGTAWPGLEDLDELRFDQADQENRPPSRKASKADVGLKRKRSRRSLISLRPVRNISNEYYDDESSSDELGVM
jgi:hypothetical protein